MIDIEATLTRSEADIQVVQDAYGGMRYFKPLSERAHEWMDENLADESTFLHGELVVELRYADDLMEGLASDGMVFFVPQWMDNPPALCDGCHEPIEGDALDLPIVMCGIAPWCVTQICDKCAVRCEVCGTTGCQSCIITLKACCSNA